MLLGRKYANKHKLLVDSIRRIQLYRTVLTAKIEIFQKSIKTLIDNSKVVINVFKHHK